MSNHEVNQQPVRDQVGYAPDYAVAVGDVLDEHLKAASMPRSDLANRLGLSGERVDQIIAGFEPVTPDIAFKLESAFGMPAHVWLGIESRYRQVKR